MIKGPQNVLQLKPFVLAKNQTLEMLDLWSDPELLPWRRDLAEPGTRTNDPLGNNETPLVRHK